MSINIETNPKIIVQKLIDETKIEQHYDKETDQTTFSYVFPSWLKLRYSDETVKTLVEHVTPVLVEFTNDMVNQKCIEVRKENI